MRLFGCYDSQYFIAIVQTSERPKRPSRTLLNNAISTQERSLQNAATSASSFLPSTYVSFRQKTASCAWRWNCVVQTVLSSARLISRPIWHG